jgi:broad specificity phosphatase PhoE
MLAAFHDAIQVHPDDPILLVGHSEALAALMCGLLDVSAAKIRHFHLAPCSLSMVELREDVPVLTLWNDVRHLEGLSDD